MEALYEWFTEIPVESVGMQGLIWVILIAGAFIFKLKLFKPKKKKEE